MYDLASLMNLYFDIAHNGSAFCIKPQLIL